MNELKKRLLESQYKDTIDLSFEPYIAEMNCIVFRDKENDPFEAVIWRSKSGRIYYSGLEYAI